ncbi:MAG TPA: hypothetical protein VFH51_13390 [Myxococcota bacterium]|nr:hypothetical protein [Myxococcota bacterium]
MGLLVHVGTLWLAATMTLDPLGTAIFLRNEREITRTFGPCDRLIRDQPTLRCRFKLRGRASETVFAFDELGHVHTVVIAFAPYPRFAEAQPLLKAVVGTLSGQFGPPVVDKAEDSGTWNWAGERGKAKLVLAKAEDAVWIVTVRLEEGSIVERLMR